VRHYGRTCAVRPIADVAAEAVERKITLLAVKQHAGFYFSELADLEAHMSGQQEPIFAFGESFLLELSGEAQGVGHLTVLNLGSRAMFVLQPFLLDLEERGFGA
jgi:hypothetical protein